VPNGGYGPNIIGGDMNTRYSESPRNGLTHVLYIRYTRLAMELKMEMAGME